MIYYYSGTGNTRYVANHLAKLTNDTAVDIMQYYGKVFTEELRHQIAMSEAIGFVFPVYSWGPAPAMVEFVNAMPATTLQGKYVWMACTCGDETALTHRMFAKTVKKAGGNLEASFSVIMPNNYVLLPSFGVDPKELEQKKLSEAPARIAKIADSIKHRDTVVDVTCGKWPYLKSWLVYQLFKKWGVQPSKWHYTDECISCGKCAQACPTKNITMSPCIDNKERPLWGKDCLSCCACFHTCPVQSVQYGKITRKMGQYLCPKK